MLTFINSSKTLQYDDEVKNLPVQEPIFAQEAQALASHMVDLGYEKMQDIMKISDKLALLNFERYVDFVSSKTVMQRAAIFAYRGDVYDGLEARSLEEDALRFGQQKLRIISGLYGVLRPLDQIKPYRMEMAYKMPFGGYPSLTAYWQERIRETVRKDLEANGNILINLASQEYSGILTEVKNMVQWIDVKFLDLSKGKYRFITLYGKRARGMMARFIMEEKIDRPVDLKEFSSGGYQFSKTDSSEHLFVFKRSVS